MKDLVTVCVYVCLFVSKPDCMSAQTITAYSYSFFLWHLS